MTTCPSTERAPLKKHLPHPLVVTYCFGLDRYGQIRPRPTRGLLIRLLEVRRSQISEPFQLVRIHDDLQTLIWVPCGWVYSLVSVSKPSFCIHPFLWKCRVTIARL